MDTNTVLFVLLAAWAILATAFDPFVPRLHRAFQAQPYERAV
jgi:hypothetical protein